MIASSEMEQSPYSARATERLMIEESRLLLAHAPPQPDATEVLHSGFQRTKSYFLLVSAQSLHVIPRYLFSFAAILKPCALILPSMRLMHATTNAFLMPIEEGDQERWDELPSGDDFLEADCREDRVGHIERVVVHGDTYSYPGPAGTLRVQHEQEKVRTAKSPNLASTSILGDVYNVCLLIVQHVP